MKIKIHAAEQMPKINTLCLVFYKERLFQPCVCYYLDDTDINIEQFGDGEGFYEAGDEYAHNKVDPNIIRGWIDLYELDEKLKESDEEPIECPLCHNKLREYVGMDGDWMCKRCNCMSGDPELWETLAEKCKQLEKAKWWLNEIVENHRFTPISTAEKALKELKEQ